MPTGYTADIATGKVTDLRTFALTAARGMGALIMMRDEPFAAPLPERFEPSTDYYDKRLIEAKDEFARLLALSGEDLEVAFKAECDGKRAEHARYQAEKTEQRNRYNAMLAKVVKWQRAPEGLKEFMLSQLHESISFDCGGDDAWMLPKETSARNWKVARLEELHHDIGFLTAKREKEIARTEQRNGWLKQLRESLDAAGDA